MPAADGTLQPRHRAFGKFQLLAKLGTGGMGEVFLAMPRSALGVRKLVVIKRLRHFDEDEFRTEAQQMFLNEGRLATRLNHPNIVQTNDVDVEGGHMYLTMEYLDGQSLHAILKHASHANRKVEDGVWAKIISDALCGLHYAHDLRDFDGTSLQIVHRDLSPHNLFVTYEGVTKIVDFGIAKADRVSAKTENGVIKGKIAYMAPEHARGDRVDRRADIFVMGVVLWELLARQRCVFRKNDMATLYRLLNEQLEPVSSVRPDIDPELDAIVARAMAHDPKDRYQTAMAMRDALEEYLATSFRKVRQEEIGGFVTDLFRNERASMQQKLQQCIAAAQEDVVDLDALPALHSGSETITGPSGSGRRPTGSVSVVAVHDNPTLAPPAKAPGKRALVAGVVATAVLCTAAFAFLARGGAERPARGDVRVAAATAAPTTAAPVPQAPLPEASAPEAPAPEIASAAEPATTAARPAMPSKRAAASAHPAPTAAPPATTAVAPAPPISHGRIFNTEM